MTKEQVFELLDKAIDHIEATFCDEACDDMLTIPLQDAVLPFEWTIERGISKAVMLIKGEPYVIKFPFYAMHDGDAYEDAYYEWSYSRDQAIERALKAKGDPNYIFAPEELRAIEKSLKWSRPQCDDDCFYIPLEGANYIPGLSELRDAPEWNYCNLECALYEKAVERGLGAYFAEEKLLGELSCGHPVYYQQRCTPICDLEIDYNSADYERKSRKARKTCDDNEIYCFNSLWISDFLEMYGLDEFIRLDAFLNEMQIGDLRDCNIGYLDNAPILFDYSGFRHWD